MHDGSSAGTVVELDAEQGFVVLKRQADPRLSRGFTEKQVLGDQVISDAIADVAQDRRAGLPCLGSALLDRVVPPVLGDLVTAGLALDGQVLAVQGPPGTGKTTQGAELIRALLDAGKTVGITATSHAVIPNLLGRVGRPAVQRCPDGAQAPGWCTPRTPTRWWTRSQAGCGWSAGQGVWSHVPARGRRGDRKRRETAANPQPVVQRPGLATVLWRPLGMLMCPATSTKELSAQAS